MNNMSINRRGGKSRRDRGPRIKDDYGIDDRDHSFNASMKDRNESRDHMRSYDRPERMSSTTFEKSNRQDRGGGGVWMDRNRDRNNNIGGSQARRITQEGEMDSSWRRGGSGNMTNSDHFNEVEGSDTGSHGVAAGNYVENRTPARGGGGAGQRLRGGGAYMEINDCCSNSQEFDGSGRHVNSGAQQPQTDRQTPRQKMENFTDNVDNNKKHTGNRGIENAGNSDNRNSSEVKEGFNAKEIMEWMCERHNAVIKAFKNQNESKRSSSQPSVNEIKMYTPTDRCWSHRPIIPSKDDFFQQLERAINQYKIYSGGSSAGMAIQGNDGNNRLLQNRTPMNQSGIAGPGGQRMPHYMPGQINLSQGIVGNVHQQQPQFSQCGLLSTPQQRHVSHPIPFAAAPMTPSHGQQQLPQMMPNFFQQQQNSQFPLPQEIVQLHSQVPHAGLIPGAAATNMPPPHIFQQYLVHQHLMHTQLQQCQSLQMPSGMPPQSNFINTPHPPMTPLSISQQQPVFPVVGQHNIQQSHLPLNGYLQSVYPAPNMEHMQPPLASPEIINLACTNTLAAANMLTASALNSGGTNFSQPPPEKPSKQQQMPSQNRERGGGGKDFECSSADSIGSLREEGGAGVGNGTANRQRCDKGINSFSSYKSQDSIEGSGISQYRGGNGGDRRAQENNKDRNNIESNSGYQRESWSRQNSKENFQRRNYTTAAHEPNISNSGNIDNQANNDAAVTVNSDNMIANNNSKRVDNFNNTNRQNAAAPPPPAAGGENQEGNNSQTFQQPNSNPQHLGRTSFSYSGTNKPQRKERNYLNDRENKGSTTTTATPNEKEGPPADQRAENRSSSKNYKHNTNLNNEIETCNNENSDDSTKNNEKNGKGYTLSTSASTSALSTTTAGGTGANPSTQQDSKIRSERETRTNSNSSNN